MGAAVRSALSDEAIRGSLVRDLRSGILAFDEHFPAHRADELRVTALLTWEGASSAAESGTPLASWASPPCDSAAGRPTDCFVHFELLPPTRKPPIKVQVRGSPRSNAVAKDSEWVRCVAQGMGAA